MLSQMANGHQSALHFASHLPIHTLIHTPTAVSAMQGTIQPVGTTDTLTLGQVEPGIEPPTFRIELLSHFHPNAKEITTPFKYQITMITLFV